VRNIPVEPRNSEESGKFGAIMESRHFASRGNERLVFSTIIVVVVVSTITAIGLWLNIGVAQTQLGTYTLHLDDAWIHQTYARNLANGNLFAYTDDRPSTGSTSPAWTLLLAVGHALGAKPVVWALALGFLFHVLISTAVFHLSLSLFHNEKLAFASAILTALEWHLTWSSLSGMETSLFVFMTLLFQLLLQTIPHKPVLLSLVGGVMFLVRPEAALLFAIGALWIGSRLQQEPKRALRVLGLMCLVFLLTILPNLAFNMVVSGKPMVGTFYAKYVQWVMPWEPWKALRYLWTVIQYFAMEGSLLLLFPLSLLAIVLAAHEHRTRIAPLVLWGIGLPIAYSFILPVLYNRGRYVMPLIPIIIALGTWGAFKILNSVAYRRVGAAIIVLSFVLMLVFWVNGIQAYALEVRVIESQHMEVAKWLKENSPADAVVATQDIGVLAYFSGRRLIDLAGLTEPEIIPVMHQPKRMGAYIREKGGTYVVVFPSYYSELIESEQMVLVFVSDKFDFHDLGVDPLAVYQMPTASAAYPLRRSVGVRSFLAYPCRPR
jgi:hypothetical protein